MVNSRAMLPQLSSCTLENLKQAGVFAGAAARVLISPLLQEIGVCHGFSTRLGGVSEGRYASLNLGDKWGDEPSRVDANLRRVAADAGFRPELLCQVAQVHSADVVTVSEVERRQRQADGMATDRPLCLGVYSADCVGMLLADGAGRVAAIHAGWRGTVAGIAEQAVHALLQLGASPKALRVALGPSIGPCCFEVQEDVAGRFRAAAPESVLSSGGRLFVDLYLANRRFLEAAGVLPMHIAGPPPCTHCDPQRFFSYRRDGAGIGQHLCFIVGGAA